MKKILLPLLLPLLAVVPSDAESTKTRDAQTKAKPQKAVQASDKKRDSKEGRLRLVIGTYTGGNSGSKGIYQMIFDPANGSLKLDGAPTLAASPSFLAFSQDGKTLYAVNETGNAAADPPGGVSSFAVDPGTGALTQLSRTSSGGAAPCHLSLDSAQQHVLVANYWGGSITALKVGRDGRLGGAASFVQHKGSAAPRQVDEAPPAKPHPHAVQVDPTGRWALVPDLGLDKVFAYPYDAARGAFGVPREFGVPPGAGPRHLVFDHDGRGVFLLNELNGTVASFSFNPVDGTLAQMQQVSALRPGHVGANSSAEIALTPDGLFLYASNRGPDQIAIFRVERPARGLSLVGFQGTLGKHPRHFAIDPSGSFLVVANRDTDSVVVFRIDPKAGTLSSVAGPVRVPRPACV
ncbi:MAG TPA: lactonase family protein, partial [Vicinamibacteria bacterium]|nr:lactonase family protein [Vicinamibacteria bacterium]